MAPKDQAFLCDQTPYIWTYETSSWLNMVLGVGVLVAVFAGNARVCARIDRFLGRAWVWACLCTFKDQAFLCDQTPYIWTYETSSWLNMVLGVGVLVAVFAGME